MNNSFEHIPQEQFRFVQMEGNLHDKRLETKARSYFQDAMLRFRKNKSSVVAAWILLFLVLFSLIAPLLSPYTMDDKRGARTISSRATPATSLQLPSWI